MWTLTNYIFPIIVGCLFACVGATILIQLARGYFHAHGASQAEWREGRSSGFLGKGAHVLRTLLESGFIAGFGLVFLLVGGFVGTSILFGPGPAERSTYLTSLFHADADEVTAVVLEPGRRPLDPSLVSHVVEITDRESIRAICTVLNQAEPSSLKYSNDIWNCMLRLDTAHTSHRCEVEYASNNGCLLFVYGDGEVMQPYFGQFRCDSLVSLLEEAAENHANDANP